MASLHPDQPSASFLHGSIALGVLTWAATEFVAMRFVQKLKTLEVLAVDDYLVLSALIVSIGIFINTVMSTMPSVGAGGYHITEYTVDQLDTFCTLALAGEVMYNCSIALSRISVLLFHQRVFSINGRSLMFSRLMVACITSLSVASIFGLIFTTNPVQAQWNVLMPHTKLNKKAFWISTCTIQILIDLAIMFIVQRRVWHLQVQRSHRVLLSLLLSLAAFAVVASIMRLYLLSVLDMTDITYNIAKVWVWTAAEAVLCVICACLPSVYSYFRMLAGRAPAKKSSWPTGTSKRQCATFGSETFKFSSKTKTTDEEDQSKKLGQVEYQIICEPNTDDDWHSMKHMDPVYARKEVAMISQ